MCYGCWRRCRDGRWNRRAIKCGLRNENQYEKARHNMNQMNTPGSRGLGVGQSAKSAAPGQAQPRQDCRAYRFVPAGTAWYRINFFLRAARGVSGPVGGCVSGSGGTIGKAAIRGKRFQIRGNTRTVMRQYAAKERASVRVLPGIAGYCRVTGPGDFSGCARSSAPRSARNGNGGKKMRRSSEAPLRHAARTAAIERIG
jgi:hypothetical protein